MGNCIAGGIPIICDMVSKQLSSEMKQLCNAMGMMLRALHEGTPWVNKAELYINMLKNSSSLSQ